MPKIRVRRHAGFGDLIKYGSGQLWLMRAIWNGVVIAESSDTIVVEGNHYFPADSIKKEYFAKTDLTTFCGWKGMANYYSVTVNGKTNRDCAWYYAEPNDAAIKIKGMVAFWNGVKVQ